MSNEEQGSSAPILATRFLLGGFIVTVVLLYAFIKWVDPLGISRSEPSSNPAFSDLEENEITSDKTGTNQIAKLPLAVTKGILSNVSRTKKLSINQNPTNTASLDPTAAFAQDEDAHFKALNAKWFSPENTVQVKTRFGIQEKYSTPSPIDTKIDQNCPSGVKSKLRREFSQNVKDLLGITGEDKFPKDAPIDKFSLFWKKGDEHFQVNAVWQMNDPPTYALEKWKASDSKMQLNAEVLALDEEQSTEVVWAGAETFLEKELKNAIEDGASEGSRIFTTTIGQHQAVFLNALPVQLVGQNFECKLTDTGDQTGRGLANCECP